MFQVLYRWRWWIWGAGVLVWTALLILPGPPGTFPLLGELRITRKWIIAKAAHIGGYAALSAFAGWLNAPMRYRFLLVFFLVAHGTLTELLQTLLVAFARGGSLQDVALDQLGIAIGIAISWRSWTRDDVPTQVT